MKKLATFIIVLIRYFEGTFPTRLRRFCYRFLLKKMGRPVTVSSATFITEPENIELGDNVSIHEFCYLSGYGGIKIGRDVSIATGVRIFSSSHPYNDPGKKIREGKLLKKAVEIGDNVWIGANVVVTPGVKIGSGVVVGAGAVVTKDLEDTGIYAGVPAILLKKRF